MENLNGMREYNPMWDGKPSFRPPKSPIPALSPFITDHGPNNFNGSKGIPRPRDGQRQHQRTSSESFLVEEQPSWLDDLLDEPETPVRKAGHRRSSSDSFTYWDMPNVSFMDGPSLPLMDQRINRGIGNPGAWATQEIDRSLEVQHCMYPHVGNYRKMPSRGPEAAMNIGGHRSGIPSMKDRIVHQRSVSSGNLSEPDFPKPNNVKKQDGEDSITHDLKCGSESNEAAAGKNCQSDSDQKRAKQRFAQRSRVRKLQYIAELERTVQALQAEGAEVTAELQFLNDQNIMLSLENETLKQRLQSLAQEHYIKHLQQEMLERERDRLRAVCQQQQQPPSVGLGHGHRRSSSRELDIQFANLSLKHKETKAGGGIPGLNI